MQTLHRNVQSGQQVWALETKIAFWKLCWPNKVDTLLKGQANHLFLLSWLLIAGKGHQTWSDFSKYVFQPSSESDETMGGFVSGGGGGINFYICALDGKHEQFLEPENFWGSRKIKVTEVETLKSLIFMMAKTFTFIEWSCSWKGWISPWAQTRQQHMFRLSASAIPSSPLPLALPGAWKLPARG